ncbi:MAG: hypothetical protein CMJ99_09695 [Planctomycetes bacterium]|nr:hypothetical protein [Planctomycetota bacterium]
MTEISLETYGMREAGHIPVRVSDHGASGGFTLIELLVVLAIISLMAGLSASAFLEARRNYGLAASAGEIQSIIRRARNQSISNGTGSFVVVEPKARLVWAQSFETMGEWSFEEDGAGQEALPGFGGLRKVGGEYIDGRLGKGISFRGGSGYIDCGHQASFDLRAGIVIEAWVRHYKKPYVRPAFKSEATSGRRRLGKRSASGSGQPSARLHTIMEKKDSWFLGMTDRGALEGVVFGSVDKGEALEYALRTNDEVVPPGRWVFISMRFDGKSLVLSADGVDRLAEYPSGLKKVGGRSVVRIPTELVSNENPVMISSKDKQASFPGDIDEVRLRGRSEKVSYSHPPFEKLLGWKKEIHFDRYGHLDPVFHDKKVRIVLLELSDDQYAVKDAVAEKKKSSRNQTDRFELTFQEWLDTWPADDVPDLVEEEEERDIEERVYSQARKKIIEIDTLGVVNVQ